MRCAIRRLTSRGVSPASSGRSLWITTRQTLTMFQQDSDVLKTHGQAPRRGENHRVPSSTWPETPTIWADTANSSGPTNIRWKSSLTSPTRRCTRSSERLLPDSELNIITVLKSYSSVAQRFQCGCGVGWSTPEQKDCQLRVGKQTKVTRRIQLVTKKSRTIQLKDNLWVCDRRLL